jgi:hypothetical protein
MKDYLADLAHIWGLLAALLGSAFGIIAIGWFVGGTWGIVVAELLYVFGLVAVVTWWYRR